MARTTADSLLSDIGDAASSLVAMLDEKNEEIERLEARCSDKDDELLTVLADLTECRAELESLRDTVGELTRAASDMEMR